MIILQKYSIYNKSRKRSFTAANQSLKKKALSEIFK